MHKFQPLFLASLALSFGTLSYARTLERPVVHSNNSARFTHTLKDLYALDESSLAKVFDLKDHKGESVFRPKTSQEGNQWATLDPVMDGAEGTSTEKVYQNVKIPSVKNEVIVAVIDSGVDIKHEDLKGHVWINFEEFYGKPGVDDDGDGYIDDIFGWNFIGNKDGTNVGSTSLEITRLYKALKKKEAASALNSEETAFLAKLSIQIEEGIASASQGLARYESFQAALILLKQNGLKEETEEGLKAVTSSDMEVLKAKQLVTLLFKRKKTSADVAKGIAYFHSELDFHYNTELDESSLIGDNPNILDEKGYGNNDVTGPDPMHGTHVSGIIAGIRDPRFGINGQAKNVKIMSLRAVPDGDERDKDVGNAIKFAVDHGAQVINMSFGKEYSPQKSYVDQAMKYAEAAGVLLVHAAGNDAKSTEEQANNFPNRRVKNSDGNTRQIETWIEVGASSKVKGVNLPADFSNYGKTSVDVFAPGVEIVSTLPGNQYGALNGTSMASPEVAGVAALLLEKFPFATAQEVKSAILGSVNKYEGLSCALPGTAKDPSPKLIPFADLSLTGGTVNAYEAMMKLYEL